MVATALAAASGDREKPAALITEGADVNAVNMFGRTPPHEAAEKGRAPTVSLLPEAGAECPGSSTEHPSLPVMRETSYTLMEKEVHIPQI